MAFSRITYVYAGSNNFAVNFPLGYLSEDHITARVNNEVDGFGDPAYRAVTFITEGTVSIGGAALVTDDEIVLERTVPKTLLTHDYSDGEILSEANLDESFKQAIMAVHEVLDGRFGVLEADIDMGGQRITNMGDAVDAQDAVTLTQLEDMTGNAPAYAAAAAASAAAALVSEGLADDAKDAALVAQGLAEDAADAAAASAALLPLNNYTAVTNPGVGDDSGDGYSIGSKWVNTALSPREAYLCLNASLGAAVWVITTLDAEDLGSAALLNSVDEDNMVSDSASLLPTQQSVKAYVDGKTDIADNTELTSGTATKLVDAALALARIPRIVHTQVPTVATSFVIGYQFRAGYDYELEINNVELSANNTAFQLDVSTDNGATYISAAGSFQWRRWYGWTTTHFSSDGSLSSTTNFVTAFAARPDKELNINIKMPNPTGASKVFSCVSTYDMIDNATDTFATGITFGRSISNLAVDKVRFSSGGAQTFKAQGTVTLWERKCT